MKKHLQNGAKTGAKSEEKSRKNEVQKSMRKKSILGSHGGVDFGFRGIGLIGLNPDRKQSKGIKSKD